MKILSSGLNLIYEIGNESLSRNNQKGNFLNKTARRKILSLRKLKMLSVMGTEYESIVK